MVSKRKRISNKLKEMRKKRMKPEQKKQKLPTQNAQMIVDFMKANNVKGNYKDYVIINGFRLIDWLASYDIKNHCEMALVHIRNLHNVVGEEAAKQFWHPKLGRLGMVKPDITPNRKKGQPC